MGDRSVMPCVGRDRGSLELEPVDLVVPCFTFAPGRIQGIVRGQFGLSDVNPLWSRANALKGTHLHDASPNNCDRRKPAPNFPNGNRNLPILVCKTDGSNPTGVIMNTPARILVLELAGVALAGLANPLGAQCWRDERVVQRAATGAAQYFPDVAARMPEVLVCQQQAFPPSVAGDYNGGAHRIRVQVQELSSGNLDAILLHELGHAAVRLRGQDHAEYGGHGMPWLRAMIGAGLRQEAERVAGHLGAWAELQTARAEVKIEQPPQGWHPEPLADRGPPSVGWNPNSAPRPTYVICHDVSVPVQHLDRFGRLVWRQRGYRQCDTTQ